MSIKLKDTIYDLVNSSTKLQTSRTIWGKSFNGESNIDGILTLNYSSGSGGIIINSTYDSLWDSSIVALKSGITENQTINFKVGKSNNSKNSAWFGFCYKGDTSDENYLCMGLDSVDNILNITGKGYVGIGTISPSYKLHVEGGTIYGDIKFKTPRTISLTGAVTGSVSFDGTSNVSITTAVNHSHSYLSLSGGTLTGPLVIEPNAKDSLTIGNGVGQFRFQNTSTETSGYSSIYAHQRGQIIFTDTSISSLKFVQYGVSTYRTIYHSGNLTSLSQLTNDTGFITGSYLPLSGGTLTGNLTFSSGTSIILSGTVGASNGSYITKSSSENSVFLASNESGGKIYLESTNSNYPYFRNKSGDYHIIHSGIIGNQSVNYANSAGSVAWGNITGKPTTFTPSSHDHYYAGSNSYGGSANSANKLATTRTIWGQNFNGEGNVDGVLTINLSSQSGYGEIVIYNKVGTNIGLGMGHKAEEYGMGFLKWKPTAANTSNKNNRISFDIYGHDNLLNILGDGKIGIGTTSPSYLLDIHGSAGDGIPLLRTNAIGTSVTWTYSASFLVPNLSTGHKSVITLGKSNSTGNTAVIYFANNGDNNTNNYLGFGIHGTNDILTVTKSGNVGIGTASPGSKLVVSGTTKTDNILFTGTIGAGAGTYLAGSGTDGLYIAANESGKKLYLESTNQSAPYFRNKSGDHTILHSGNWSSFISVSGGNYLPLSGGTLTGVLSINTSTSQSLCVNHTSAPSSWNDFIKCLNPHLTTTYHTAHLTFGYKYSEKNIGYIGFRFAGDGSVNNLLTLGLHSVDNILNINAAGNVGIGTLTPGYKLQVSGSFSCSTFYIGNDQITFTT